MFKIIDCSEYFIFTCILLSIIGIGWGFIKADYFLGLILLFSIFVLFISISRIRKFGVSYHVMKTVDEFKLENDKLTNNVVDLENQNIELDKNNKELNNKLEDMGKLMGIFKESNKTAKEIQDDMISTMKKLEEENNRYTTLNKTHAFILSDRDGDGVLSKSEQETLKLIGSEKFTDRDGDGFLSKSEYLTFN